MAKNKAIILLFGTIIGLAIISLTAYTQGSGIFMPAETEPEKQKPGVNRSANGLQKYFHPDMDLIDVQWEAFGTPEWAEDRMEMWPTDYVSLIVVGKATTEAINRKFVGETKYGYGTPNAERPWLPDSMKFTMRRIVKNEKIPAGIRCRLIPPSSAPRYQDGYACTDGEYVMYFLVLSYNM